MNNQDGLSWREAHVEFLSARRALGFKQPELPPKMLEEQLLDRWNLTMRNYYHLHTLLGRLFPVMENSHALLLTCHADSDRYSGETLSALCKLAERAYCTLTCSLFQLVPDEGRNGRNTRTQWHVAEMSQEQVCWPELRPSGVAVAALEQWEDSLLLQMDSADLNYFEGFKMSLRRRQSPDPFIAYCQLVAGEILSDAMEVLNLLDCLAISPELLNHFTTNFRVLLYRALPPDLRRQADAA